MKQKIFYGALIGIGLLAALFLGIALAFAIENQNDFSLESGSYLGTIGAAIVSFVGVVLLYLTYQSQRLELRATQKALNQQKVDAAFFNMLSLLQDIISTMSFKVVGTDGHVEVIVGRPYLRYALNELLSKHLKGVTINMRPNLDTGLFNPYLASLDILTGKDEDRNSEEVRYEISTSYKELLNEVALKYEEFYLGHQQNLGHYFRYVYNILKYVSEPSNDIPEQDQHRYRAILQAQMSNDEMGLLFYNVLSTHGRARDGQYRFLGWLDDYGLLENMDAQSLTTLWHHWFFPKTMFKFLSEDEMKRKQEYKINLTKFGIVQ